MTGRPTKYTPELGDEICARIAEPESLIHICEDKHMPTKSTVLLWVAKGDRGDEQYKAFSDQYRRAREAQSEGLLDETVSIADDGKNDTYKDEDGNKRTDYDVIARSKVRIETRFRLAEKMHPKKYGIKQQIDLNADVSLGKITDDKLDGLIEQLAAKAGLVVAVAGEGKTAQPSQALHDVPGDGHAPA